MSQDRAPIRTWRGLERGLVERQRGELHEQLGCAVAQLHSITFDAFGEIQSDGGVMPATTYLDGLAAWVRRRVANPAHVQLFTNLLAEHAALFADVGQPQLTHEDLNSGNILARRRDPGWQL